MGVGHVIEETEDIEMEVSDKARKMLVLKRRSRVNFPLFPSKVLFMGR